MWLEREQGVAWDSPKSWQQQHPFDFLKCSWVSHHLGMLKHFSLWPLFTSLLPEECGKDQRMAFVSSDFGLLPCKAALKRWEWTSLIIQPFQNDLSKLHEEHISVCIAASPGVTVCAEPHLHQFKASIFHEDSIAVNEMPGVRPAFPEPSIIWMIHECRGNMKGIWQCSSKAWDKAALKWHFPKCYSNQTIHICWNDVSAPRSKAWPTLCCSHWCSDQIIDLFICFSGRVSIWFVHLLPIPVTSVAEL